MTIVARTDAHGQGDRRPDRWGHAPEQKTKHVHGFSQALVGWVRSKNLRHRELPALGADQSDESRQDDPPARHPTSTEETRTVRRRTVAGLPRRSGPCARWVQALAAVLLGIASTRGDTSIPPPNPRNRANRHWRWRAYHTCRARSLVRLARVASIVGALSERDAGPPATRRSCLRPTLTKSTRWRGE